MLSLVQTDVGAVRESNEKTAFRSSEQFEAFCASLDFFDITFSYTPGPDAERMLVAFAMDVLSGKWALRGGEVALTTVKNYVRAASQFAIDAGNPDPRFRYDSFGQRLGTHYCPGLNDLYALLAKWRKGKRQALPLTPSIIKCLFRRAAAAAISNPFAAITAIRDGVILGTYTGSRCSEYCRGKFKAGTQFSAVPVTPTTGPFGGLPIALISDDFTYFNSNFELIPWTIAFTHAQYVTVRFRYDKGGGQNFSERTFGRTSTQTSSTTSFDSFLCPVATTLRILHRWSQISNDPSVPVFCYRNSLKSAKIAFLDDAAVTTELRECTREAYPNPTHLFRIRINDIRTHSVRVFACLALVITGFADHVIEFKLRWSSKSWKDYLRENVHEIGADTIRLFQAAFSTPPRFTTIPVEFQTACDDTL